MRYALSTALHSSIRQILIVDRYSLWHNVFFFGLQVQIFEVPIP